jgi:comEA protein
MHVNALAGRRFVAGILVAMLLATGVAPIWAASPPSSGQSSSAKPVPAAPVNVNTATTADLETVPGIGQTLARRIVEFRDKNGPFDQVDDLVKVSGIGEKSILRLKPYLTVGPAKAR